MSPNLRPVASFVLGFPLLAVVVSAQQPQPALTGLARDVACATMSPAERPQASLTVAGGREIRKTLFAPGDSVIVRGGASQGVRVGDEYYVRRVVEDRVTDEVNGRRPISVHTAGVIRIVEAYADVSAGIVTQGCDGVSEGDYLERYAPPTLPQDTAASTPDFSAPARVILGAERRQIGATGEFMVLDRGSDHGMRAGQQLTVFRPASEAAGPITTVGTAKVYAVLARTSTIRIERSVDAVYVGDLVAIHR
jgi:hypothetical protein